MTTYLSYIISTTRKGNSYIATIAKGINSLTSYLDYSILIYVTENTFADEEQAIDSAKNFIQVLEGIAEF